MELTIAASSVPSEQGDPQPNIKSDMNHSQVGTRFSAPNHVMQGLPLAMIGWRGGRFVTALYRTLILAMGHL